MKKMLFVNMAFAGAVIVLAGCGNPKVSVVDGLPPISHSAVKSRPVELPGGYDVDDFARLRMMVADGSIDSNSSALRGQKKYMNTRFQSEMQKHKRFDFNAVHGLGDANRMLSGMVDSNLLDSGDMEEGEEDDAKYGKMPDLLLGWTIDIQEQKEADGKYAQIFRWLCTVNATVRYTRDIKGPDGKIKHHKSDIAITEDFDLPIIEKEQVLNGVGAVKSGFSYKSDAAVQGLMQEIVIAASKRIADMLGRRFPVGGNIVGALGNDLMTMDAGSEQGVEKAMEMVIFARCDDVDVPLANAVASPSKTKSQLEIWRFADDRHAERILDQIGDNPKAWMKSTGYKLYCVRAVPPQDETVGTRFED